MKMNRHIAFLILGLWICPMLVSADVMIHEIMYHPASEDDREEYIELYNPDDEAHDLSGWRFIKGVDFEFAEGVRIESGGYLVIASDPSVFGAAYPEADSPLPDGWVGRLSNRGEKLVLRNREGGVVDSLSYADGGDWATRKRGEPDHGFLGWEWFALHDGGGSSLELINAGLPNSIGTNWGSSREKKGTPGSMNSVTDLDTAPLISLVEHRPLLPRPSETVTVSTTVFADSDSTPLVHLHYRIGESGFSRIPMYDDGLHDDHRSGDGIFAVVLSPFAEDGIVEFYVEAIGADGLLRTWPPPALLETGEFEQRTNAFFLVSSETASRGMPTYHMIMRPADWLELKTIDYQSNAQMHGSFIQSGESGSVVRHGAGIRLRGASSRRVEVKSYRIEFPSDNLWKDVSNINLNARQPHAQLIGSLLSLRSGLPAAETRLVRLRLNGMDLSFHGDGQFGVYAHVEVINSDFARRHYPLDDNGNVYKCTRFNTDLRYLGADPQRYRDYGYHKRSNESLDDWSDLIGLTLALSSSTPDDYYLETVSQVADIRMWVRYFAVTVLQEYAETALATGVGDDYSLYRGVLDTRFRVVPHDFDTILGEGDFGGDVSRPIFISTRLTSINRFLDHPEIRSLFFEELARLMETVFSPESVDSMLDNMLDGFVPPSVIQRMKTFNRRRNENVRLQIESLGVVLPSDLPGLSVELPPGRLPGIDDNPDVIIPPKAGLRLCEILAVNRTTLNHQDRYPDWIEICNTGQNTMSLDSVGLDDDLDFEDAFQFPPGILLGPGERLVVFDGAVLNGTSIRLGFGLSGSGDSLFLTEGLDSQRVIVDQVVFGDQIADHSIALFGEDEWRLAFPTPGKDNEPTVTGFPDQLRINEWLAVGGKGEEFIEIFNRDALPVSMGGLHLSDQPLGRPNRQTFPPLSFVEGKGFFRVSNLNFRLNALQGRLGLFSKDLHLIDFVQYGLQRRAVSQGRFPDGNSSLVSLVEPSLGKPNSALGRHLQILEVYPGEDHFETNKESLTGWLELWNPSEVPVSVKDYFLKSDPEGDPNYPFEEAIEIPPLERLTVGWPVGFFLDELDRDALSGSIGGRVSLMRLNQDGLSVVADQVSFGRLPSGYSLSRDSVDSDVWLLSRPTPGKVNQGVPTGNRTRLRINEWSAASGRSEDWIEIFNSAAQPVDLGGCFLTDDPDDSRSFEIPSYTYLTDGPDAFLTLRAEQSTGGGLPALTFGLNTQKESVWLLGPRGNLIDFITFENLQPDHTEGRLPDGGGAFFRFPNSGSPGRSNNVDSDQNGLPDVWEQLFGLKPQPGDDTDLDGRSDHAEFLDGTDPTDPLSRFGFDALVFQPDFGSRLSLTAVSGQSYGIFYQNRLGESRSLLQAVFANPISRIIEIDDPESRFHDQRFYQMLSPMPAVPEFRGDTALSFVMNQTPKSIALEIGHSRYDIDQLLVTWTISDPDVFPDERVSVRLEDDWILEVSPGPFQTGSSEIEVTVTDPAGFSTMKSISLRSVDPGRRDWNQDGWEDLFFQGADGDLWVWFLDDLQVNEAHPPDADKLRGSQWRVAGVGEFNQDGHPDLLLEHPGGDSVAWLMEGIVRIESVPTIPGNHAGWTIEAVADFNRDGISDLLFQGENGEVVIWLLAFRESNPQALVFDKLIHPRFGRLPEPEWSIVGARDFNADGYPDLLLDNQRGFFGIWLLKGDELSQAVLFDKPDGYGGEVRTAGILDMNGDGRPDILFRHLGGKHHGDLTLLIMENTNIIRETVLDWNLPDDWELVP